MKNCSKKLLTFLLAAALAVSAAFPALAGQWRFLEGGEDWQWWYEEDGGSYPVNEWREIDSIWYHFDSEGYLDVGWHYLDGKWYYMETSGAMMKNTVFDGGSLGQDGAWAGERKTPGNYLTCSEEDYAYWIEKMERYGISGDMFVQTDENTYVMTYAFDSNTAVQPDLYSTAQAAASFRFNGYTSVCVLSNGLLTFTVTNPGVY